MNYNDRGGMDINADLKNGYVSSVIGLPDSHTLYQFNE